MGKTEFIKTMAPLAQAQRYKRDKWILPSVCIAQAALETGWGSSSLMTKANAYFGIKAGTSWKGKVYSTKTKECYDGVTFVSITDAFRAYDSLEDSVADYMAFLSGLSRYSKAVNETDPEKAITAIKTGGYATDPEYVKKIMAIIKANDLTKYDAISNPYSRPGDPITKESDKTHIKWLQFELNYQIEKGKLSGINTKLTIDGIWGAKTAAAVKAYLKCKGWLTDKQTGYYVGVGTISALVNWK